MSGMLRASIRWCLAALLLAAYVPIPAASGPAASPSQSRSACCAPKACCTVEHACSSGGGCASKVDAVAVSQGGTGTSTPVLRAGRCHPEAARVGATPTLDPIVFVTLPAGMSGARFLHSGADEVVGPPARFSSPQVPPPRA